MGGSCRALGAILGDLGRSWVISESLGWMEGSGGSLGASWRVLGRSWDDLGTISCHFGTRVGAKNVGFPFDFIGFREQ